LRSSAAGELQLVALEAALAALAIAVGFALTALPNVELFTFVVFLSGVLLGSRSGMRVGGLAAIGYGLLNPYGLPGPPLLAALVVSRMLIGIAGGWARPVVLGGSLARRTAALVLAAVGCTLVFQTLTTIALAITLGQWRATLVGAVPFALWNLAWNVAFFPVLGVACVDVARRLPIPGLTSREEE
jgi:hypothetical protein